MKTMKILFTIALALMLAVGAQAQVKYKLVRLDESGSVITGAALETELRAEGFTVPFMPSAKPSIEKPVRPTVSRWTPEGRVAWDHYTLALRAYQSELKALTTERTSIYTAFTLELSQKFVIITYGKTGRDLPDGRPEITWYLETKPKYKHSQFAMILLGYNTKSWNKGDPIKWISYKSHIE